MADPIKTCPHGVLYYDHEERERECLACSAEQKDARIAELEHSLVDTRRVALGNAKAVFAAEAERDALRELVSLWLAAVEDPALTKMPVDDRVGRSSSLVEMSRKVLGDG